MQKRGEAGSTHHHVTRYGVGFFQSLSLPLPGGSVGAGHGRHHCQVHRSPWWARTQAGTQQELDAHTGNEVSE